MPLVVTKVLHSDIRASKATLVYASMGRTILLRYLCDSCWRKKILGVMTSMGHTSPSIGAIHATTLDDCEKRQVGELRPAP